MVKSRLDIFALIGLLLIAIPIGCWIAILRKHFLKLKNCTLRVQTLITRTALFLPAYAILLWISLAVPAIFGIMEGPISICEGLSFYGFFATIVSNLGGPDKTLQAMITQNKKPFGCCPSDHVKFYNGVRRGLFQFLVIRPITVTVAQLFSYNNIPTLYALVNAISMVQFLWGFCSIIFFYENVYPIVPNVNGGCKLLLLKVSVGGIVLQNLILDILYSSGTLNIKGNGEYTGQERSERALCMVILLEYCLISALVLWAFGSDVETHEKDKRLSVAHTGPEDRPDITWTQWRNRVFSIMDVFHDLAPSSSLLLEDALGGNAGTSVSTPL